MKLTNTNSENLHYVRPGIVKSDEKILLIHGNLASANWWKPTMRLLQNKYDVLAVDLRGFGQSPAGSEHVTLHDHAQDLAKLIVNEAFYPAVVVGHSLGGAVAMQLTYERPDLVKALVLLDSAPIAGMTDIQYDLLEEVLQKKEFLVGSLLGTMVQEVDQALWPELADDCLKGKDALIPNTRALDQADFRTKATEYVKPVLLIHGEKDVLVPLTAAQEALKYYRNSRLVVLPDCGHAPQVEKTQEFVQCLREFIEGVKSK